MKYFLKLNVISILYAIMVFVPLELMLNVYRISRLTNWAIGEKGTFACLLPQIFNSTVSPVICGLLAILRHVFPVFAGFKGGKAVATATGVLLMKCSTY